MKKNFLFAALAGVVLLATGCQKTPEEPNDPDPVAVTGVTLGKTGITLVEGKTETLTPIIAPTNATDKEVEWSSDNEAAATVEKGVVTAVKEGEAKITVTTKDGGYTDVCTVTVTKAVVLVQSISLNETSVFLAPDGTFTLIATVLPANADNKAVVWRTTYTSGDYAEIDQNGTVTGIAPGKTIVTATAADGSGKSAACEITVREPSPFGTVSFASAATWKVGEQTWSDTVTATACKKNLFNGGDIGAYKADCRQNEGYGDMFSWEAVNLYGDLLCPDGWHVPTGNDYSVLDKTLNNLEQSTARNNDKISVDNFTDPSKWNAQYGGYVISSVNEVNITGRNEYAYYWTRTDGDQSRYALHFSIVRVTNSINPGYGSAKYYGMPLRCVK